MNNSEDIMKVVIGIEVEVNVRRYFRIQTYDSGVKGLYMV